MIKKYLNWIRRRSKQLPGINTGLTSDKLKETTDWLNGYPLPRFSLKQYLLRFFRQSCLKSFYQDQAFEEAEYIFSRLPREEIQRRYDCAMDISPYIPWTRVKEKFSPFSRVERMQLMVFFLEILHALLSVTKEDLE